MGMYPIPDVPVTGRRAQDNQLARIVKYILLGAPWDYTDPANPQPPARTDQLYNFGVLSKLARQHSNFEVKNLTGSPITGNWLTYVVGGGEEISAEIGTITKVAIALSQGKSSVDNLDGSPADCGRFWRLQFVMIPAEWGVQKLASLSADDLAQIDVWDCPQVMIDPNEFKMDAAPNEQLVIPVKGTAMIFNPAGTTDYPSYYLGKTSVHLNSHGTLTGPTDLTAWQVVPFGNATS